MWSSVRRTAALGLRLQSTSAMPSVAAAAVGAAFTAPAAATTPPPAQRTIRVPGYKTVKAPPAAGTAAAAAKPLPKTSSCAEDVGPVVARPLSALQKRQLAMKDKQAFALTPIALHRVHQLLGNYNSGAESAKTGLKAVGIRVGVKRRGCSGYSYTINYAFDKDPNIKPADTHVEQDGVHVYVDHAALFYVIGTVMNFVTSNVEEKFTFQNPNKTHECGCNESFMVEGGR